LATAAISACPLHETVIMVTGAGTGAALAAMAGASSIPDIAAIVIAKPHIAFFQA
jgi:hypothetical protein